MNCIRCMAATENTVELVDRNGPVGLMVFCADCFAFAKARELELSQQFDALISAGLTRTEANSEMIKVVEGRGARA